jgi:hypothetical protein
LHAHAGCRTCNVALLHDGSVQLLNDDGSYFSIPITNGEAGINEDGDGYYFHSESEGG